MFDQNAAPLPRELTARIRAQIEVIADEMVKEIQARIPEYARPGDETYARVVRVGVGEALRHFVDLLDGAPPSAGWHDLFEAIGAGEQHEGRSLDTLQAALRLCARLGWRWLVGFAEAEGAAPRTLGALAEVIFTFLDDIADASATGYGRAQAAAAGELDRRRRRLVELLLADPPAAPEAVAAAAQAARWALPRRLAAVAVEPRSALSTPPVFGPDVLASFERPEPCLLVPDPEEPGRARALVAGLGPFRTAIGPAVPPSAAVRSLRWARDALALARRGVLPDQGPVWCRDHLATLAVFSDEELLGVLVERRLAPLRGARQRDLLADTLFAWLRLDKNASEVAARLHVHPQTVRYRLRQLDRLFGPDLREPARRFELEVALLADRARRGLVAD